MNKLTVASVFTLGLLSTFVLGIILATGLFLDGVSLLPSIAIVIVFNFLMWLVGPAISDWTNKLFYKLRFPDQSEIDQKYAPVVEIMNRVSAEYGFKTPRLAIIPDQNPTAFTYGSHRNNARIVLTEGMFTYLSIDEIRAVVAHELGHVVNRDFIIMSVASSLLQILYTIYANTTKGKGNSDSKDYLALVGFVAYVLYIIGVYLLYFLSRTREYSADEFAAKQTKANDLSNALIKIAYGIVSAQDTKKATTLLNSTRQLGVIDIKNAKHYGLAAYSTSDPNSLSEVMVFDKVSPWAKISEISSTHPLTGKRIDKLSELSQSTGQPFSYDVKAAEIRLNIDRAKLYNGFSTGLVVYLLPLLAPIVTFLITYNIVFVLVALLIATIVRVLYKFPADVPDQTTTILDQMRNPYASPVRGTPIAINGSVVGRGIPGYIFSEDMIFQDQTGILFLNHTSSLGVLGNIFFAIKKVTALFGKPGQAQGWFLRGNASLLELKRLDIEGQTIKSYPKLWGILPSLTIIVLVLFWLFSV